MRKFIDGMKYVENHPKQHEFFYLDKMISEAGYPYASTFWKENFNGGDPEKNIDWDSFYFNIQICGAGMPFPIISVEIADNGKLNLKDFRNAQDIEIRSEDQLRELCIAYDGITSEQAMEIIDDYFRSI